MDPGILAQVLRQISQTFQNNTDARLLVGLSAADDAAVYQLSETQAIISTVDFFTPIVDDPYDYGAIAAANSLSDVYAMGGEALFALNIIAFPPALDPAILAEIIRGGAETVRQAGALVVGGHSIQDKEPKFGLAVTGLVHPQRIFTKGGARPGDQLILTKPLGTGTISTALKRELADPAHITAMIQSMKRLNRQAARAGQAADVRSATDITGFGLLGHAKEMVEAGQIRFRIQFSALPFLPGAVDYAAQNLFPGGSKKNRAFFGSGVTFAADMDENRQMLLWDAQTSGGLLLAVNPAKVEIFMGEMAAANEPAWRIGDVTDGRGIEIL